MIESVEVPLSVVECEGHGRYFEVYRMRNTPDAERGEVESWLGTFSTAAEVCGRFPGRLAWVSGYDRYERWMAEHPEIDPGDGGGPDPELRFILPGFPRVSAFRCVYEHDGDAVGASWWAVNTSGAWYPVCDYDRATWWDGTPLDERDERFEPIERIPNPLGPEVWTDHYLGRDERLVIR